MPQVYQDPEQCTELRDFILHAIHCHRLEPVPLTIEAGLVAVGDGSDMTKGRGRIAFDLGNMDIHSVFALSIDRMMIAKGQELPVKIIISMSNSAGIFQVQETLTEKVIEGPLHDYITVRATTQPEDSPVDSRIVYPVSLKGRHFITTWPFQ